MLVTFTMLRFCGADGGSVRGEGREGWEGGVGERGRGDKGGEGNEIVRGQQEMYSQHKHFMHVLMTYDLC